MSRAFLSARVIRTQRIARGIVRGLGLLLLYPAAWHFGGWWGLAALVGFLLITPSVDS